MMEQIENCKGVIHQYDFISWKFLFIVSNSKCDV